MQNLLNGRNSLLANTNYTKTQKNERKWQNKELSELVSGNQASNHLRLHRRSIRSSTPKTASAASKIASSQEY